MTSQVKPSRLLEGVIKWLQPYIDRNETLESFKDDCGTMGGSFEVDSFRGYLDISGGVVSIRDRESIVVFKATLKTVFPDKKQLTLL